jgi:type II secretory pathway component PulC
MDNLERAKLLIGLTAPSIRESAPSVSSTNTHTVTGTATSDSKDGYVMVDMGGDSVTYGSEQSVKLATTVTVKEGDTVIINLTGADGTGKTPVVIGVVGRGDEQDGFRNGIRSCPGGNNRAEGSR